MPCMMMPRRLLAMNTPSRDCGCPSTDFAARLIPMNWKPFGRGPGARRLSHIERRLSPYREAPRRSAGGVGGTGFRPDRQDARLRPQSGRAAVPMMSGKKAFLELLKQEGVDIVFGNPGTTELPLMDAFATENEIRYLLGLQEAAIMSMADGYAQASGKLAVCNFHTTPGLGNALGMLYDAQKAGAPILVTAGQHEQSFTATEPILWADLPVIARPLVKWSFEVHRLADLPRLVHRAAKTALAPPTGPVFLSLPGDILRAGV